MEWSDDLYTNKMKWSDNLYIDKLNSKTLVLIYIISFGKGTISYIF